MFRTVFLFRLLGLGLLAAYFFLAASFLGLQYWVLPQIDQWRPQIAQLLSTSLGMQVTLDKVAADWTRLNPVLELSGVALTDRHQRAVLRLPHVQAVVSWRSLFDWSPRFQRIEATGLDLRIRRDQQRQFWVLGRSFELSEAPEEEDFNINRSALAWLVEQRQIVLNGSTLRWLDETRSSMPLVLRQVDLKLTSQGQEHYLSLSATPPPGLGGAFDARGQFTLTGNETSDVASAWDALLYVRVDDMKPLNWRTWLDIPSNLDSGEVSAQVWAEVEGGRLARLTSDVAVRNGHWSVGPDSDLRADSARFYLSGPWAGFKKIFSPLAPLTQELGAANMAADIDLRLQAQSLTLHLDDVFSHPLVINEAGVYGRLGRQEGGAIKMVFDRVLVVNKDMDVQLQGSWEQGGSSSAGLADISAVFKRASIAAIGSYLPNSVNADARQWMAHGLLEGQIRNAQLTLSGDLVHFPFDEDPSQGDFKVEGRYSNGVIDYAPAGKGTLGWPRLTAMSGAVGMYRNDLRLTADTATLWTTPATPVALTNVRARIPDLVNESVLTVQGETAGSGQAYMALMTHSPLGGLLGGAFNEARGEGAWKVPLHLTIPLNHVEDTTVLGAIRFAGGTVSLKPEFPSFTQLIGDLKFSETGVGARNLKARFLGGAVVLNGGLGGSEKGLKMQGQTSASALTPLVGLDGMKRLTGNLAYQAVLHYAKPDAYTLTVDSDLTGLALDFPEPLGKTAASTLPLHVKWQDKGKAADPVLDIVLGSVAKARFMHRKKDTKGAYFYAGVVGVHQSPQPLPAGLNIDVSYPRIDLQKWDQVIDEFSSASGEKRPLLPGVQQFRLKSELAEFQDIKLDALTLSATQPEPARWRVDINAVQTQGTLFWREASGKIAGKVDARFERLALGAANQDTAAAAPGDDERSPLNDYLDIPAVSLEVDKLTLYGRLAGRLSVEGVNQARGELWQLNKLSLIGAGGQLHGTGMWRLNGPQRGLVLDAQAQFSDLGQYLSQVDMKNVIAGGQGTVKGRLEWHNLPWKYQKSDLNGELDIELHNGRFITLNSRSARLLELLSLQSIQRLAMFKFNPANLAKEGFPFDDLRGKVDVRRGVLNTANYRVTGPVATIVIEGDVNLTSQKIDLQTVVVPNLDVSGAAIAAGIAVNPIIGIGAFLTQWLLRSPLAKAMTVQYHVTGNWDAPVVTEIAQITESKKETPHN